MTVIWMIFGACFYTMLVGTISSFVAVIDSKGHELAEKAMIINELCKQSQIDPELKEHMKSAIEYQMNNDFFAIFKNSTILDGASVNLKYRVPSADSVLASNEHPERPAKVAPLLRLSGVQSSCHIGEQAAAAQGGTRRRDLPQG